MKKIFISALVSVFVLAASTVVLGQGLKINTQNSRPKPVVSGNNLYCAGFVQIAPLNTAPRQETNRPNKIVGAYDEQDGWLYSQNKYLFINGGDDKGVHVGDMLSMRFPVASFDAAVCVSGVFFVPDMSKAVSELWSRVRPGGKLAVTTWGPNFCEPATDAFWCSIKEVRPDLYKGFNPWDRIDNPASLAKILDEGGVASPKIIPENRFHIIKSPDDWWTIVLGSGYRGTIEQLTLTERQKVKEANLAFIRDKKISAVETNVLYALAKRPQTATL